MPERRTRRRRARIVAALVAAAVGATTFATGPGSAGAAPPPPVLEERMHGEAAIRALGHRLPEVAEANGMDADELRRRLRADDALWVDETGALLFVDEVHAEPANAAPTDPAWLDHAPADALSLHSRPGADRVIFLDFDGHDPSGSNWDDTPAQPYDTDGAPATFSDAERRVIIEVWQRVAEDFAPFAIDVTTADPGIDAIRRTTESDQRYGTRVVVTPTVSNCTGCGGVAYLGAFDAFGGSATSGWEHDRHQPAWVYLNGHTAKSIAEAASHEAGHNLGLDHDGSATKAYYEGQGDWAPIMGVGYYRPLSQWSKGEYTGATNTEDDLAVIAEHGGVPAADDHGDTPAAATPVGSVVDVSGDIGTRGDVDAFAFTTGGGTVAVDASPIGTGANLDLVLRLVRDTGEVVTTVDGAGLGARIELAVPAGSYALVVDGVGAGDPGTTGYSDYASLGRYRIAGTVPGIAEDQPDPGTGEPEPDPEVTAPAAPQLIVGDPAADGSVLVTWGADASVTQFEVYRETRHKSGTYRARTLLGTVAGSGSSWTDRPGSGTFRYQVIARNAAGTAQSAYSVVTVSSSGSDGSTKGGGKGKPGTAKLR